MDTLPEGFRGWYPGSKQLLPVDDPEPDKSQEKNSKKAREEEAWDARPVTKIIRGKEVEFFSIGAVAKSLDKSVVTIRHWIRMGYMPQAAYRMPDRQAIKGRRLYTRAQVEAIIAVAKSHGLDGGGRITWANHTSFAPEVRQAWANLPPL